MWRRGLPLSEPFDLAFPFLLHRCDRESQFTIATRQRRIYTYVRLRTARGITQTRGVRRNALAMKTTLMPHLRTSFISSWLYILTCYQVYMLYILPGGLFHLRLHHSIYIVYIVYIYIRFVSRIYIYIYSAQYEERELVTISVFSHFLGH